MTQQRLFPKPLRDGEVTLFASAGQAWFWFVRCQAARIEGARVVADAGDVTRPCDPDDIYNAVMRLWRGGEIGQAHLQVLEYYGAVERVPDPRVIEEQRKAVLWDEALAALGNVLIRRNIVDPDGAALAEDAENDTDQEMQGDFTPCHF
jgi:ADP-dependent phosphofructokinase/glucokinase